MSKAKIDAALEFLMAHACPSIRLRLLREMDGLEKNEYEIGLKAEIYNDKKVANVMSNQQKDGWIWNVFHGTHSHEAGIRTLCEKGFTSNDKEVRIIPAWFSEGLAVIVSNGAGAEDYSDSAAIDWINQGKCFTPTKNGNFIKTSAQYDEALPWDMFYRQTSLFVDYLAKSNSVAFQLLIKDIENNINFKKTFVNNYRKSIQEEFDNFKEGLKTK